MTDTILFHNPGEIDIRAVTTFGLSVKETDSPIGYFGTGLKYAVAVALREGCEIEIYAGTDRFSFHSQKESFRGQDCDLVFMTGPSGDVSQLPFTLHLGKNWKLWQAYRELYCNAIDEAGGVCDKHDVTEGRADKTFVVVRGAAFAAVHEGRQAYINNDTPILATSQVSLVPTRGVFLKSIRVADAIYRPTMFGYSFTSGIKLTEDRTMADPFEAEWLVKNAIAGSADYDLATTILTAPEGTFEAQISWTGVTPTMVGDEFKRALIDLARNRPSAISPQAKELAKALDQKGSAAVSHELTATEQQAFDRAKDFLSRQGVRIDEFPVEFVETLGEGVMGQAKGGAIFIAAECFDYGVKMLVATLYEEHVHLARGFADLTRSMQNHLFHTIVGLWEEREGCAL